MADHSFNAVAKKLDSTETQYHLAQLQPQLESDLKQYQRRQIYGRPIQNTSSAASRIIPPQIYDVAFFTLRVVVARVNPVSATPITHLLRNELDDFQICELIRDLCGDGGSKLAKKVHTVAQPRLDPNRGKALRTKIEQARALHARKLGDEDMVDVDIIYKCSHYRVEPFRTDMGTLAARGARLYHMYPFREREKEMALSVIVAPDVLAGVYPPERCAAEHIFIKTNTAPVTLATLTAAVPESLGVAGEGTIFPNWHPAMANVIPKVGLSRVCSKVGLRGRSSSVQEVVHSSSQLPMRTFSSSTDMDAREVKEKAPFQNDPGFFEEQWLVDELAEHTKNLDEWHRATWKTCSNNKIPHRHMSDDCDRVPSSNNTPGDDFIVKTPLCTTYTADRDMAWYNDNVEHTALQDYEAALATYKEAIAIAEQFYECIGQLFIQSKQIYAPASTIQTLRDACSQKELILHNLKETRQTAAERAGYCKCQLDATDLCKPEWLESQWRKLIKPHTAEHQHPGPLMIRPPPTVGNTPRPELQSPVRQNLREMKQGGARDAHTVAPAGHQQNPVRRQAITHDLNMDTIVPAKQATQQGQTPMLKQSDSMINEPFPTYRKEVSGPADHAGGTSPFGRVQVEHAVTKADKPSDLTVGIKGINLDCHMIPKLARTKRATTPLSSLVDPVTLNGWRATVGRDESDGEDSDEDEPITLSRPRAATGVSRRHLAVEDHDSESGSSNAEVQQR